MTYSPALLVELRDWMSLLEPNEAQFHDHMRRKTFLYHRIDGELN